MKRNALTLLSFGLLLLVWQLLAWRIGNEHLFPSLPVLLQTFGELVATPAFYQHVGITVGRGCLGLALSLCAAFLTAILLRRSTTLRQLFAPWLALMRSVPIISFILLALVFLNPESIPLLIAFLTMYPLLTENLLNGLIQLRPEWSVMAKQFHLSARNVIFQIIYPQLKPYLFSGLASAVGFGWRAIIMGEVLAQCMSGIGSAMKRAQLFIAVPELMAWTLIAILLSWLSDKLLSRLSRWQPGIAYKKAFTAAEIIAKPMDMQVENISYRYGVKHFSQTFEAGQIYALSAPSGSGKTTLLRLLNGTLQPTEGAIRNRPPRIANVFQEPELLPHLSAKENILLAGAAFLPYPELEQRATALLTAFELDAHADALPIELSYGQQQRVAIARALIFPAPLLLMDEPFKGLDAELRHRIIQLLLAWQRSTHATLIFSSHSEAEIAEMGGKKTTL